MVSKKTIVRKRTPLQRLSLTGALLTGVAPIVFGIVRAVNTGTEYSMLIMALVATSFAVGVLSAAIGRRRTKRAISKDAMVIFTVATLLSAAVAYVMGATSAPGIWAVAVAFGASLAIASLGVAYARATNASAH